MKVSKSTLFLSASFIFSSAVIVLSDKKINIFHCTTRVDSLYKTSSLHADYQVFIYNDHTGFMQHKGTLISDGVAYPVDRDINFELYDDNKDGVMTFISKGVVKKPVDRVPDENLWNMAYASGVKYYPSFVQTVSGDTIIIGGGKPNYVCSQKNE